MLRLNAASLLRCSALRSGQRSLVHSAQPRHRLFQTVARTTSILDGPVSSLHCRREVADPNKAFSAQASMLRWRHFSTQDGPGAETSKDKTENDAKASSTVDGETETTAAGEDKEKEKEPEKSELEVAQEKIEALESQLAESKDHVLRALAETENVRARFTKEVESARTYGIQKFAKQVVEVADNLHRAIDSIPEEERTNDSPDNHHLFALCEGVEMTRKELEKVFASNGIVEYGQVGDAFDPHVHEAMFQMPDPTKEPNTIGQVLKTGYKFKDRVLRPAQVGTVVASPSSS